MTEKYQNKYRVASARLQGWDYRNAGAYFITICTANKEHYFGNIENGKMNLSCIGVIADILWYEIKNHHKNVELGEFVVMPNHVHGIIFLNDDNCKNNDTVHDFNVETLHATSLQHAMPQQSQYSKISPKANSISTIIRSYKSAVTKHARRLGYNFAWQTRFHDHVIRNEKSLAMITDYIQHNPEKWEEDRFYGQTGY